MDGDTTLYELVGGRQWFVDLVDDFYAGVETDPRLAPMYPADLTGPRERLSGFLVQYWGGPTTYSDERGHPRLRMRHAPFPIDEAARDAWFAHMSAAVEHRGLDSAVEQVVLQYFATAASAMINQPTSRV